jgi:type VI secretion system Hcp family effector
VDAVSMGIDRPAAGSGAQLEWADSTLQDVVVTKQADKSTPKLCQLILTGDVMDEVTIDFCTSTAGTGPETTRYQIVLEKVRLTSYSYSDASGGSSGSDTVTLNYETIKWNYTEISDTETAGAIEFKWDVITAQPA